MKKYSMNKNFIPRNIVLEREKKEESGEKRAIIMLFITCLAIFPLLNEKKEEEKIEVNIEEKKDITYNHKNIEEELDLLNISLEDFKSNNGNIELELNDISELEKLEKLEKFKINTIANSGDNNYRVSVRRK